MFLVKRSGFMNNKELLRWFNNTLKPELVKDYCPNGLQVEGKSQVEKVVTGVTACQALINAAIERQADAIVVHHGYFWKGESPEIIGMKRKRLMRLLEHGINLYAYHLPIDVHPEFGNNRSLGDLFGLDNVKAFDGIKPDGIVMRGEFVEAKPAEEVANLVEKALNRKPLIIADEQAMVKTMAWCSGGGQSFIEQVLGQGIDMFLSGEASEQTVHTAREMDIAFMAAGHHATERYGVKHLGERLAVETGLSVEFVDIDNPV